MTTSCFVCDEPGSPDVGSSLVCHNHPEGEVKWRTFETPRHTMSEKTIWDGKTIPYIDFTGPDALSSPA